MRCGFRVYRYCFVCFIGNLLVVCLFVFVLVWRGWCCYVLVWRLGFDCLVSLPGCRSLLFGVFIVLVFILIWLLTLISFNVVWLVFLLAMILGFWWLVCIVWDCVDLTWRLYLMVRVISFSLVDFHICFCRWNLIGVCFSVCLFCGWILYCVVISFCLRFVCLYVLFFGYCLCFEIGLICLCILLLWV